MTPDKKLSFRLTADLWNKLVQAADSNQRTMSAEIIARLLSTFKRSKP